MVHPGCMDKLLEVQGKEELEILTLGYCRSKHYISLRKIIKIFLENNFFKNFRSHASIVKRFGTGKCWTNMLSIITRKKEM